MPAKAQRGGDDVRLANETRVAEILGIEPRTLRHARSTGIGPYASLRWFKLGSDQQSPVRYDLHHLFNIWLPAHEKNSGSGKAA